MTSMKKQEKFVQNLEGVKQNIQCRMRVNNFVLQSEELIEKREEDQKKRTYKLVLISSDCSEDGFRKDEGSMLLEIEIRDWNIGGRGIRSKDQMDSRLISMHGVQHDLWNQRKERERSIS